MRKTLSQQIAISCHCNILYFYEMCVLYDKIPTGLQNTNSLVVKSVINYFNCYNNYFVPMFAVVKIQWYIK